MNKFLTIMCTAALMLLATSCQDRAQYLMGEADKLFYGVENVHINRFEAARLYGEVAQMGVPEAQLQYGRLWQTVHCDDKPNLAESEKWLTMAAEQANSDAMWELAVLFSREDYAQPDKALQWARKSADAGNPIGKYYLATILLGQNNDDAQALELLKTAFNELNKLEPEANEYQLRTLAHLYAAGNVCQQDKAKAAQLYTRASVIGDPASQLLLSEYYRNGEGVERDTVEAKLWNDLATRQLVKAAKPKQ